MIHKAIQAYFDQKGYLFLDYQKELILHFDGQAQGIVEAATGRGKTLAMLMAVLNQGLISGKPQKMLWITPMRALSNDTALQIQAAVEAIMPHLKVMLRTGDSTAYQKTKVRQSDWDILITTPEGCSILAAHSDAATLFRRVGVVVIDEWHALYPTKRGVLLELFLAWLRKVAPHHRRWALSATLADPALAAAYLLGKGACVHIQDTYKKQIHSKVLLPSTVKEHYLGSLGIGLIPQVIKEIKAVQSSLLFTNTRSQSEKWFQALQDSGAFKAQEIAIHHSAIDQALRKQAESGVRQGAIRCLVATSSLDLGVDLKPVDKVLHLGSPKGFERLKQRAGRSGHNPFAAADLVFIPRHSFEVIEAFAASQDINNALVADNREIYMPYDILMQHLVSLAFAGDFSFQDIRAMCDDTFTFSKLSNQHLKWLLDFCCNQHGILKAYPEHIKLVEQEGLYSLNHSTLIKRAHKLSMGTITSDDSLTVVFKTRKKLGQIEEHFIRQLQPNDSFLFAGKILKLIKIQDNQAVVALSKSKVPKFTQWLGGSMPVSTQLSQVLLAYLDRYHLDSKSLPSEVTQLLDWQAECSRVPSSCDCLIECTQLEGLPTLFLYPFAGRLAHQSLAFALSYYFSHVHNMLVACTVNDYGLMLQAEKTIDWQQLDWQALLAPQFIQEYATKGFNANQRVLQEFRQICLVAGLIYRGLPGKYKKPNYIYSSAQILYEVFRDYDVDNLFLIQAQQMVLQTEAFPKRLADRLDFIQNNMCMESLAKCSPFGFSLYQEQVLARLGN